MKFVDVHVWACKSNGSAGDGIVNYHRPSDPAEGVEVLTIDIHKRLGSRNLTPAHELFHLFQNGYTLFKNRWYTEGVCRWAELALGKGAGRAGPLPARREDIEKLFGLAYGASRFWNALARETDSVGKIAAPPDLLALRYVGIDAAVVEDDVLYGAAFVKALLEELDRMDDVASRENGLDPLNWKESRQMSPENNRYVWAAVLSACRRFQAESPKLRSWLAGVAAEPQRTRRDVGKR